MAVGPLHLRAIWSLKAPFRIVRIPEHLAISEEVFSPLVEYPREPKSKLWEYIEIISELY